MSKYFLPITKMAATQAFVQMVLGSVCMQQLTLPQNSSLELQRAFFNNACDRRQEKLWRPEGQLLLFAPALPNVSHAFNTSALRGRTLRFAVKQVPTSDYLSSALETDRWSIQLVDMLSRVFQFRVQYIAAPSGTGGIVHSRSGKWMGVMGQIVRQEADLSGSLLAVTSERVNVVSFSETVAHTQVGLLLPRLRTHTHVFALLTPFTTHVWIWILVTVMLMGPVIWTIIGLRVWLAPAAQPLNQRFSMWACVWFVYGGIVKQGSVLNPTPASSRLLFATWWIFITVVTAFYMGNLTAHMTFSSRRVHFGSLQELGASDMSWIAYGGDAIQTFIESSPELMEMKYRGRGAYLTNNEATDEVINYVLAGKHVYVAEVSQLNALMMRDYHASNRTCRLMVAPLKDQHFRLALLEPLGGELNAIFDPFIRWVVTAGITDKWRREAEADTAACTTQDHIQGNTLKNESLAMLYYILLIAYAVGLVFFLLELLLHWLRKQCEVRILSDDQARSTLSTRFLRRILLPASKTSWPLHRAESEITDSISRGSSWNGFIFDEGSNASVEAALPGRRTEAQVLAKMRQHVKVINGRPYMFVTQQGGITPVEVSEKNNAVLESIFGQIQERPPTGVSAVKDSAQ